MSNSKYLLLIFALVAVKVCCDPVWVNQSFSIPPILLITTEILPLPPVRTLVELYSGPENQTNLFALATSINKTESNDISILNTTTLSSVREFFDIGSLYPFETVAIVSLPGYVFYTAVIQTRGYSEILGFPMLPGAYFPDEFVIANSSDKNTKFKVLQLLARGDNPVVVYTQTNQTNQSLYAALILADEKTVATSVFIASGNITNVTCDTEIEAASVLCLYKLNDTVYRVYLDLNDEDASPIIKSQSTDDVNSTYYPQQVVAVRDVYFYFSACQKASHTELIAQVYDASSKAVSNSSSNATSNSSYSKNSSASSSNTKTLRRFNTNDSTPLQGALPYDDGIAAYYREFDDSGNQTWYYRIYNKDLSVNGTEVKLADVPGADSGFKVAIEYGAGAVNIAAYTYTTWHGAVVLNIYYGQVLKKTPF